MELQVTESKLETGTYTTYAFTHRGTDYQIVTRDHEEFNVWSNRFGKSGFGRGTLTVYWSMDELARRGKIFADFVEGLRHFRAMIEEVNA